MFFSKIVDSYALNKLHKTKSQEYQYIGVPNSVPKLSDRETFYHAPKINFSFDFQEYSKGYRIGTFEGKSVISTNYPSNDKITGEAFIKDEDGPHVIFVHGWRAESFDQVKKIFHKSITKDLGWNMYYFTLPYHFQREPSQSLYSGEFMISANIKRSLAAIRQAIVDLRCFIQWIKENKKGPVVIVGISLGGFITNLLATVESKIDVLTSIFYSNRLSYSIWNTLPGKYIKADLEHYDVEYEDLIRYWEITDPSKALPKVKKKNVLLISAQHDRYVHIEDTDYLWESWGKPTRYVYPCGHAGLVLKRKRIEKDTLSFINNKIKR